MTPLDYASRIIPLDVDGHNFVVSLGDESWKHVISLGQSSERADLIVLNARRVVGAQIAHALRDEDCRLACLIEEEIRTGNLSIPELAAQFCREQSANHLYYI